MIRLLFATQNPNKVAEIQSAIGDRIQVISLADVGILDDIPEPHDTLEANATEKSTTIYKRTNIACFSEDTGLEIDALHGAPGVKSARYAGEDRSPEKNMQKVLNEMKGLTDRAARFRTIISLIWNGKEYLFEGICEGHIITEPQGSKGFGYDPIFIPIGSDVTFASMAMVEKNRYSHRKKAVEKLIRFLQENMHV